MIPRGFYVVTREDGTRYARPSFAMLRDMHGAAWDGARMRVVELGRAS